MCSHRLSPSLCIVWVLSLTGFEILQQTVVLAAFSCSLSVFGRQASPRFPGRGDLQHRLLLLPLRHQLFLNIRRKLRKHLRVHISRELTVRRLGEWRSPFFHDVLSWKCTCARRPLVIHCGRWIQLVYGLFNALGIWWVCKWRCCWVGLAGRGARQGVYVGGR